MASYLFEGGHQSTVPTLIGEGRAEFIEKLINSCRALHREVPSVHNPNPMGHFSARIPGTDERVIKPRDVAWNKVTDDDLITYTLDYRKVSGPDYEIVEIPIHIECIITEQTLPQLYTPTRPMPPSWGRSVSSWSY